MNLERLSTNLVKIIEEVLNNQELVNLIGYNGDFPILPPKLPINKKDIAPNGNDQRIYPYPFDVEFIGEERAQLHIYYPEFKFVNNANASEVIMIFDVIVHKSIWLMMDNKKKVLRPYQIIDRIVKLFKNKNIDGVGKIHFLSGTHTMVNKEFEGVRLVCKFTEF